MILFLTRQSETKMIPVLFSCLCFLLTQDILNGLPNVISPQKDGSKSISIAENTKNGSTIFTVQPYNSSWTYRILTSSVPFSIDNSNGIVKVDGLLDFEMNPSTNQYIINIRISDSNSSYVDRILTIHITNVYDVFPVLTVVPTKITIPEEMAPDTTLPVRVTDTDPEKSYGDEPTYSLTGSDSIYFKIDPRTGSIFVEGRIDYEAGLKSLTLNVTVTDRGGNSNSTTITITIQNINDNSPICSPHSIQTSISENKEITRDVIALNLITLLVGDVATLKCKDIDSTTALKYVIISGDDRTPTFDMSGPRLKTARSLDYETTPGYILTIHVTDDSAGLIGSVRTGTVTVTVQVLDVNEDPPRWSPTSHVIDIKENYPGGKIIYTCVASDPDAQPGQTLAYSIVSVKDNIGNDKSRNFQVNTLKGEISAVVNLDYESGSIKYTVMVQANDTGIPPLTSNLTLTLNVKDVNDNPPIFNQSSYTYKVKENEALHTSVGKVTATDEDTDTTNNVISYSLDSATKGDISHFTVDSIGSIHTAISLDRETIPIYILVVRAEDNGFPRLTATTTVTVTVDDVNDCPPEFDSSSYSGSVPEGPTGLLNPILTVKVIDRDSTASTASLCIDNTTSSGTKASSFFKISQSGISYKISLKKEIDRETDPKFVFNIIVVGALSKLTSTATATATVTITVSDVNEAPEWITPTTKVVSVSEAVDVGFLVMTVSAVDGDTGPGGRVGYSLDSSSPKFRLNSATGEVKTTAKLDFDKTPRSYSLTISAHDAGTPSLSAIPDLTLTITVTDVNDNPPVFTQNTYTFSILENQNPGIPVSGHVPLHANDNDSSPYSNIRYEMQTLLKGDSIPFTIRNSNNGTISTTRTLDREYCDTYVMIVKAIDGGVPALTGSTTVSVTVLDENDNSPEFDSQSYTGSVREDAGVGTSILTVIVTDPDAGTNGDVTMSVVPNTEGAFSTFALNSSTGVLSVKRNNVLDRESISTYTFHIQAVDAASLTNKRTGTASVTITVTDANDNVPYMSPTFYNMEVDFTGVCGSNITTVRAYDNDIGNNSHVTYSLVHSSFEFLFSIDPDSGVFSIRSLAAKNFLYIIRAVAHDGGDPSHVSNSSANVRVDTFDLEEVAVTFRLEIDKVAFEAHNATFMSEVEALIKVNFSGAILKVCCVELRSGTAIIPTTTRRRLLQTSSPVDVHVYAVDGNVTDDAANINMSKTFLKNSQLTSVFSTDPSGTPVTTLTTGAMEYFHIQTVTPYHLHVTPWSETLDGIVIITFIVILTVTFIVVLIVVICYAHKRRKRPVRPVRQTLKSAKKRPTRAVVPDIDEIKKRPSSALMSLPLPTYSLKPLAGENGVSNIKPKRGSRADDLPTLYSSGTGSVVTNRDFEGTAVDEETGRVYRYNTRTNERQWVSTPEGRSVKVTHH